MAQGLAQGCPLSAISSATMKTIVAPMKAIVVPMKAAAKVVPVMKVSDAGELISKAAGTAEAGAAPQAAAFDYTKFGGAVAASVS